MYPVKNLKSLRRFSNIFSMKKPRAFSVITRSAQMSNDIQLGFSQVGENVELETKFNNASNLNNSNEAIERTIGEELCFTKDKAFLKFVSMINLESQDKESISVARLIAMNVYSQLKKEQNISDDVIHGIVKGLRVILLNLKQTSNKWKGLVSFERLSEVYSKGVADINNLVTSLHQGETRKRLVVTKEVSGKLLHEGAVDVHPTLSIKAGYSSYSFVNDDLNYRVDLEKPIIAVSEELNFEDVDEILEVSSELNRNVVFVWLTPQNSLEKYILSKKQSSKIGWALVNLSETGNFDTESLSELADHLEPMNDVNLNSKVQLKSAERVIMDNQVTSILDSSFATKEDLKESPLFEELAEIHLRSYDEIWIHEFKNDLLEADENLKNSLENGVLPDLYVSLNLANEDLKSYYSEDPMVQRGVEIIQNSLDSLISISGNDLSNISDLSIEKVMEECASAGSFIPVTKANNIIADVVTICNHLLQNEQR